MSDVPLDGLVTINKKQRNFLRFSFNTLVDVTVLNLFAQLWDDVYVLNFGVSLIAGMLLQIMLVATIAIEHKVSHYFSKRPGTGNKVLKYFLLWLVLFGSKFAMLGAIDLVLGESILFHGAYHGVIAFILVVVTMIVTEQIFARVFQSLGNKK